MCLVARFVRAAWLAAWHYVRILPLPSGIQTAGRGAWFVLTSFLPKRRAPLKISQARLEACLRCPLYNHPLGTCGTPGETWWNSERQEQEPFGCWCFMEVAVRVPVKTCFLCDVNQNRNGLGWPEELNGEIVYDVIRREINPDH